jgi:hypothetical protein
MGRRRSDSAEGERRKMSETEERLVSDNTAKSAREGREREKDRLREGIQEKDKRGRSPDERKRERRRKKERVNEHSFVCEETLFSLSLSLFCARTHAEKERRARRTRSFARSETKLVAFRGTRDGADGGDGGTTGQKRITRVITTLINK